MNKKLWLPLTFIIILLALLFTPLPSESYDDGGTREFISLTYKIVDWNRLYEDTVFDKTKIYFGENKNKSVDELWKIESKDFFQSFLAEIIEISGGSVLVSPLEGEEEKTGCDQISFSTADLEKLPVSKGTVVRVTYSGEIMTSYPAGIVATDWEIENDLRHISYREEWLDKATAEKATDTPFEDIIITRIYSDCFFATPVYPLPTQIKLNGTLGDEWCVGDQVICTYENTYRDKDEFRIEADMLSIKESTLKLDPNVCYKPVIYLYPEKETEVSVKLETNGKLTCTYPRYNNGWEITASPDGTLTDRNGKAYNYLYWEGETFTEYDMSEGFCVKGNDTAEFLEYALGKLGLNRREANEFIVFWLPMMEKNPYNIISFRNEDYTESAKLSISPSPDTLIRVFMAWSPSDEFIDIPSQKLASPERTGFTVIEWGGTQVR